VATWPASIPQTFDQNGFSYEPEENLVRTRMETGPEKTRVRFTAARTFLSGTMTMSRAEYITLMSFHDSTTVFGTQSFTFTDPVTETTGTFKFRKPPSIAGAVSDELTVGIALEKLP
jgi:hypothetical protein